MTGNIDISVVVPVYREMDNIKPFLARAEKLLAHMQVSYEIIFCLDPSPDSTEEVISQEISRNPNIRLLVFSRRFGQPAATMAGILLCKGRTCVVMDVDLQDPPELIEDLYNRLHEGYEVVYAKRRLRKGETFIKKMVARTGYKLISMLSEVPIPRDAGDFRIISRRVIEELRLLQESHGFLRGMVAHIGFKQTFIEYDRSERAHGRGNYNRFFGSLQIGLNGVIGFSRKPLQLLWAAGSLLTGSSVIYGAWLIVQNQLGDCRPSGSTATVLAVVFFSGIQLLCLALMGEYVGRIYDEVKRRPMFVIDKKINF